MICIVLADQELIMCTAYNLSTWMDLNVGSPVHVLIKDSYFAEIVIYLDLYSNFQVPGPAVSVTGGVFLTSNHSNPRGT